MTGHIELRHNADATGARIADNLPRLFLGVELPVGPHAGQLRKYFALDAEALIVGKVPVEDVQLDGRHAV